MSSDPLENDRFIPRGMRILLLAVISALGYLISELVPSDGSKANAPSKTVSAPHRSAGSRAIQEAFAQGKSDLLVEVSGRVKRTLADDREGAPHQKWILELEDGHTVLVAHNLDLAPRVPLQAGDEIIVRGEYEYSREGGVLHWTHDDPAGRHPGGWVELKGKRYE